jgi:hypothetical protein
MNYSPEIAPGDILPVEIETLPALGNKNENESESRIYGAIMIPSQDYDTARISLAVNDTVESLLTTIAPRQQLHAGSGTWRSQARCS